MPIGHAVGTKDVVTGEDFHWHSCQFVVADLTGGGCGGGRRDGGRWRWDGGQGCGGRRWDGGRWDGLKLSQYLQKVQQLAVQIEEVHLRLLIVKEE